MSTSKEVKQRVKILLDARQFARAKAILNDALKDAPDDIDVLFGLGVAHAREGDLRTAEQYLEKVILQRPTVPGPYLHLANIQRQINKPDQAIANFRCALAIKSDLYDAHLHLAGLLMTKKWLEDAVFHFRQAIKIQPENADAQANLGQVYELQNNLAGAKLCANNALAQKSDHLGALMLIGRISKRENDFATAGMHFRKVLLSSTDEAVRAAASIELGHVLDKQKKYDEAYSSFSSGKACWSRLAHKLPFDRTYYKSAIRNNTDFFIRNGAIAEKTTEINRDSRRQPLFFVGFPRSGTTLTEQILGQHPDVVTSYEKPLIQNTIENLKDTLGTDLPYPICLRGVSDSDIRKIRDSYWTQVQREIDNYSREMLLVDKQPMNIVELGFVSRVFPDSRILVAIRDPRDVCLSCFMQSFSMNPAMINFLSMDSTVEFYTDVMGLWLQYRTAVSNHWHEFRYEDLLDNFEGVTRGIFQFLGLDYPENASRFYQTDKPMTVNTPSYQDVTRPIYGHSKSRWIHYKKHLAPYMASLTPYIEEFGYGGI